MNSFNNGHLILSGLALDHAIKIVSQKKVSKTDLSDAIDTVRAAHWTKPIINGMAQGRINFFLRLLRSTKIEQTAYAAIRDTLVDPVETDNIPTEKWSLWDEMMLKYGLHTTKEYVDLRSTIKMLHQGTVKTPVDLIELDKKQAFALDLALFARGTVVTLWQCAKCQFEYPTGRTTKDSTVTPPHYHG